MAGFNLEDIPQDVQEELYEKLGKALKKRDNPNVTREDKLKATADVLRALVGFTLAQQRGILIFTISVIEDSQHRFWRDNRHQVKKSNKASKSRGG